MCDVEFCFYSDNKIALEKLHKELSGLYSWLPRRKDNMRMFFFGKRQFDALFYFDYMFWSCDKKVKLKDGLYYFYIDVYGGEFQDNYDIIPCMCTYISEAYSEKIGVVYSSDINGHYIVTTNDKKKMFFDELARLSYCMYDSNGKIISYIDKEFDSIKEAEKFIKDNDIEKVDEAYDFLIYEYCYEEYNSNISFG